MTKAWTEISISNRRPWWPGNVQPAEEYEAQQRREEAEEARERTRLVYHRRPTDPSASHARRPKHVDRALSKTCDRQVWRTAHDIAERIHLDALLLDRRHDFGNVLSAVEKERPDLGFDDHLPLAFMVVGILLKKARAIPVPARCRQA